MYEQFNCTRVTIVCFQTEIENSQVEKNVNKEIGHCANIRRN